MSAPHCSFQVNRTSISIFMIVMLPFLGVAQGTNIEIPRSGNPRADSILQFEKRLNRLRTNLNIPAYSAAVVKDNEIIWAKGFGYADIRNKIMATDSTSYRVASITKTYASAIIMQLVNEGLIDLEAKALDYSSDIPVNEDVKVKHLLSHTSQYKPGKIFRYSGARFGLLEEVIIGATGKTFSELFVERILIPLELKNTAPSVWSDSLLFPELTSNFKKVYKNLAKPYRLREDYSISQSRYIMGFMVAGGLVTTVHDMARYNIALDSNFFFDELTTTKIYSPTISSDGNLLPYGYGWFVQQLGNLEAVWHYGWHPDAASSLILKIPEKNISFMIFANSDMLSKPFSLHNGNVLNSPAAQLFLKTFLPNVYYELDLTKKEKIINEIVLKSTGKMPLISIFQTILLIICQVFFILTIIFWPIRYLAITIFKTRFKGVKKESSSGFIARVFMWLLCLACFILLGALFYYPPMIFWHEFQGWFDGVPLYQNLTLALPSLIAILSIFLIPIAIRIWTRKMWLRIHRIHYSIVILLIGLYLILLNHWHLMGINYYWKFLIYN